MKRTIANNPPIFANAGRETINVVNIVLRDPALLISLRTLTILKSLRTEVAVPILLKIYPYSNATPIAEIKTTNKSKLLKGSRKNILPKAIILKIDSRKKMPKKVRFP